MCDGSGNLIAWLDRELAGNEAADVERHVRVCSECRSELESYKRVSRAFNTYCEAAVTSKVHRKLPRWIPILSGAAAAVALLLTLPRTTVEQPRLHPQAAAAPAATVSESGSPVMHATKPTKRTHLRQAVAPVQSQETIWTTAEPAIQIAIPAEAMFPPGAVPQGVNFTADVSIGADGSVQRLRLQPRLAGFERRPNQP